MNKPTIKDLTALIVSVKSDISDEYRAFDFDETPGIQLTVAMNDNGEWTYQTGDNSYMGGAYNMPYWSVNGVYRNTNPREMAREIQAELLDNCSIAMDDANF